MRLNSVQEIGCDTVVYYLGPRDPNRLGIKLEPVFEARDSYQGIATRFRKSPVSYYIFQTEFCKHPR